VTSVATDRGAAPAVLVDREGHAMIITLNRPARRNAFDAEVICRLADAWDAVDSDPDVRVAIMTGAGGNFSAGGDLNLIEVLLNERSPRDDYEERIASDWGRGDLSVIYKAFLKDHQVAKPIIAAVEGCCFAGGMEILQAFDIRVAGATAQFAISEVQRGLFPLSASTIRLPRQIPFTVAMEMLLLGEPISGTRAYEVGLVGHAVTDGHALTRAKQLAERLAANGPMAVRNIKASVLQTACLPEHNAFPLEAVLGMAVMNSRDAQEGVEAFLEKRHPVYTGE
jgi:enoyl-CoA hydratase